MIDEVIDESDTSFYSFKTMKYDYFIKIPLSFFYQLNVKINYKLQEKGE